MSPGDADNALCEVEIACVRVNRDGAAEIGTGVNDEQLAPVRVAELVGEALGDVAAVAGRDRWDVAYTRPSHNRHNKPGLPQNHEDDDESDDYRRYEHALAA